MNNYPDLILYKFQFIVLCENAGEHLMKNDIQTKADIPLLINTFYEKVRSNETIGYIFNDIARVNWEHHMPIMYDFWEGILFHTGPYAGNPMLIHQKLHERHPLTAAHFAEWLRLFKQTVDELFEGTNAEVIKQRAQSIATVMQLKITKPPITIQGN